MRRIGLCVGVMLCGFGCLGVPFLPLVFAFGLDALEAFGSRWVVFDGGMGDVGYGKGVDDALRASLKGMNEFVPAEKGLELILGLGILDNASLEGMACVASQVPSLYLLREVMGTRASIWRDASTRQRAIEVASASILRLADETAVSYSPVPVLTVAGELLVEASVATGGARLEREGLTVYLGENPMERCLRGETLMLDGTDIGGMCPAIVNGRTFGKLGQGFDILFEGDGFLGGGNRFLSGGGINKIRRGMEMEPPSKYSEITPPSKYTDKEPSSKKSAFSLPPGVVPKHSSSYLPLNACNMEHEQTECDQLGRQFDGFLGEKEEEKEIPKFDCVSRTTTLLGAGMFRLKSSMQRHSDDWNRIPALVHQTWKTADPAQIPDRWQRASLSWRPTPTLHTHVVPWVRVVWSDRALPALVRLTDRRLWEEGGEESYALQSFFGYLHPIQRIDAVRYSMLLAIGGVYSDLDISKRPNRPWEDRMLSIGAAIPLTNPFGLSQDLVLTSPGHPLAARFVRRLSRHAWPARCVNLISRFAAIMFAAGPWYVSWQELVFRYECADQRCPEWFLPHLLTADEYGGGANSFVGHVEGGSWHDSESSFYWVAMQILRGEMHMEHGPQLVAAILLLLTLCIIGCCLGMAIEKRLCPQKRPRRNSDPTTPNETNSPHPQHQSSQDAARRRHPHPM